MRWRDGRFVKKYSELADLVVGKIYDDIDGEHWIYYGLHDNYHGDFVHAIIYQNGEIEEDYMITIEDGLISLTDFDYSTLKKNYRHVDVKYKG